MTRVLCACKAVVPSNAETTIRMMPTTCTFTRRSSVSCLMLQFWNAETDVSLRVERTGIVKPVTSPANLIRITPARDHCASSFVTLELCKSLLLPGLISRDGRPRRFRGKIFGAGVRPRTDSSGHHGTMPADRRVGEAAADILAAVFRRTCLHRCWRDRHHQPGRACLRKQRAFANDCHAGHFTEGGTSLALDACDRKISARISRAESDQLRGKLSAGEVSDLLGKTRSRRHLPGARLAASTRER